jgi:hypothetical protein
MKSHEVERNLWDFSDTVKLEGCFYRYYLLDQKLPF